MVRGTFFFEKCKLFFSRIFDPPEKHENPPWTTPHWKVEIGFARMFCNRTGPEILELLKPEMGKPDRAGPKFPTTGPDRTRPG